jgi:hypothetical protein
MIEPRPSVTRFVMAVARAELAVGGGAHDFELAQRILVRLHQELGKLIGSAGFDVLLARSVVLARRVHPILSGITAGPGGTLVVGGGAARDDAASLREGAMAIVSCFIELLVNLIGEDLAMGLLRNVWPATAEETKK